MVTVLWAPGAHAQGAPAPAAIRAPHYGDTLFNFYQDRFFGAITGLMVSQHFARVAPHDDEAEVLRGGMMLSYGLHEQATEVFARLIERNAPVSVRDRAWFFLARIRHQRGLAQQAQESLDRISEPLKGALEDDRQLLRAQLMMGRQDYVGAAAVLDAMKTSPTAGLYARFNLGVALVKTGGPQETERGLALLDEVGQAQGPNEELRSLRDRANVALGFAALQDKKPREARNALQRVRLNSAQSNKALLGYGWAASELNDPKLALVPWQELAQRNITDAAVLEAHIAVPYAMSEIGSYSGALERYQAATEVFKREKLRLDESIAAIRAGLLVKGLLSQNPVSADVGLDAFARMDKLPEMPHTTHLVPLLADNPFQESFKHLRDLQFLSGNLAQWQGSLGTFTDMLDNRKAAFAHRLPKVRAQAGAVDMAQLQQRRDDLAAALKKADDTQDAVVFANPKERDFLERLERARATLAQAQGTPQASVLGDTAERLRRVSGALTWQLQQQFSGRAWVARKALRDTDAGLTQARDRDAALLQAQRDEPARHERFAARIQELTARLQALQPRVAALDAETQTALQDIAVAELEGQKQRLDLYDAQARLAIAQILDRAQLAQRDERALAPAGAKP
jgi:tetratricopeptide (TPR) repeat protein